MHLILVLVGVVVAFAGASLIYSAIPVVDAAAAALFSSGIFAIVGALILFALAVVARGIERIAERLEVQPLTAPSVPPVATVTREEIAPRPARAEPAPAPAPVAAPPPPEPPARALLKRPSVLSSWLNRASPAATKRPRPAPAGTNEPPADQAEAAPSDRIPDEPPPPPPPSAAPVPMEPPITIAPIVAAPPPPPPPAPAPPQPPSPPAAAPGPAGPIIPRAVASVAPPASPPPFIPRPVAPTARPVPPPAPSSPAATVYKSGVIDGMAYTLFMDGAIEAELPQGRVRFGSVDELQKYLTNRG